MQDAGEVTRALQALRNGSRDDEERLFELVYAELKRVAAAHIRAERPGHTLTPTALVHEAYMRLLGRIDRQLENRTHFISFAARVMRQVLVDHERARNAVKRALPGFPISAAESLGIAEPETDDQILALDEALQKLSAMSPRQSRVVELRYFGGLNEEEIAALLGVTRRTVDRDWKLARTWLYTEMSRGAQQ